MNNDKFLGHNGFLWFTGVVEDRGDPQKAGRVRVSALGHHTSNTTILPTKALGSLDTSVMVMIDRK